MKTSEKLGGYALPRTKELPVHSIIIFVFFSPLNLRIPQSGRNLERHFGYTAELTFSKREVHWLGMGGLCGKRCRSTEERNT